MSQEEYDKQMAEQNERVNKDLIDAMAAKGTPEYDQALLTNFSGQYPNNLYVNAK